jgi:biopolymer transport protein TolR
MPRLTRMRREEGINEPNMTPLIDVSLVLVVILLVATPMALQSGIAVQNAAKAGRAAKEAARTERIDIVIVSADSLIVNRQAVNRATLGQCLGPLLAQSATRTVVVRCAPTVPHGAFVSVLDQAKTLGAAQIAVLGG